MDVTTRNHLKGTLSLFFFGGVLFIFFTQVSEGWVEPLNSYTTSMVFNLLKLWGQEPSVNGTIITLNGFTVHIIGECTSLYLLFLFSFFVILSSAGKKEKILGLLMGVPIVDGLNNLRIAVSIIIGAYRNQWFHFFHTYLTQVFSIGVVLLACFAWLRYSSGRNKGIPFWGFLGRFFLLGTLFSFLWIPINRPFVFSLDYLLSQAFHLWSINLHFTYYHQIYFQTFNLPVFFALMLASSNSLLRNNRKIFLFGTGMIILSHLIIRLLNVFMGVFKWEIMAFAGGFCLVVQYLLPIALWGMTFKQSESLRKVGLLS